MGLQRNGARTFLNLLAKCCRLSHLPGFRTAVFEIVGPGASAFFTLWDPTCAAVETLIASDNWFNQIDYHVDTAGNEDQVYIPPGV